MDVILYYEKNMEIKTMFLTDQGLDEIGKVADEKHNFNLMFLVQILKELREIKMLLKEHQYSGNSSNCCSSGTDNCENQHS